MAVTFKDSYFLPERFQTQSLASEYDLNSVFDQSYVNRTILSALGSFWYEKFSKEFQALNTLAGAMTAKLGEQYQSLLNMVMSSSVVDIPIHDTVRQELYAFNRQDASYVYNESDELQYIAFDYPDIRDISYVHNRLFGSDIILDKGNYFDIVDGQIRFYVDIFSEETILTSSYVYGAGNQVILFWVSGICFQETYIYDRFGRHLYAKQANSEGYKNLLTALQYFFVRAKSAYNIEAILNILFGLPFCKTPGEVVESIDTINSAGEITSGTVDFNGNAEADTPDELVGLGWYTRVTTNANVYYVPLYAETLVTEGQTLTGFQPVGRVHQAQDYITHPDWYDDAKFPFELVDELKDYSKLTVPEEFHSYIPHRADGTVNYDGEFRYTGEYAVFNGINPFLGTRSKSAEEGGSDFEQTLHALVDNVLKYNLLYLKTELNFENVEYYQDNDIKQSFEAIRQGVPTYIYPVIETFFNAEFMDSFDDLEGEFSTDVEMTSMEDSYAVCPARSYDGSVMPSNPMEFVYSGKYSYDGSIQCYPYGGPDGVFYDCWQEKEDYGVSFEQTDDFKTLGFHPVSTFEPPAEYWLYNGTKSYSGEVDPQPHRGWWELKESEAFVEMIEDPIEVNDSFNAGVETAPMEDLAGSYDGSVGLNNTVENTHGALETGYYAYSGVLVYDGAVEPAEYIVEPRIVPTDGSQTYYGYEVTGYTYGQNLPPGINIHDELEITIHRLEAA